MWSGDIGQLFRMRGQRVGAESERAAAKRWSSFTSWQCSCRWRSPRTDEVVVGPIRRVVEASIVHRMLEEQRGDARDTKSVRGARGSRVQPKQLRVGHALVL